MNAYRDKLVKAESLISKGEPVKALDLLQGVYVALDEGRVKAMYGEGYEEHVRDKIYALGQDIVIALGLTDTLLTFLDHIAGV